MSVLVAEQLQKNFGAVTAAKDISLSFDADTVVGLIGANGAGKTTFLNMVTGYLKPDSGRIRFDGRDIVGLNPRQIARLGISRSFQIPQLFQTLCGRDNLLIAESIAAAGDPGGAPPPPRDRRRAGAVRAWILRLTARGTAARRYPQAARRGDGAVEPLAAAAARRADQRRLGGREIRHHDSRDDRRACRRRDCDLRRA
jgi:ABC-type branched-subunit amino acid transport system ATPase component